MVWNVSRKKCLPSSATDLYLEDNARCFCGRTLVVTTLAGVRETRLQGNKSRRWLSNSSGLRHASLNHALKYLTIHPVSSPNRKCLVCFVSRLVSRGSSSKAIRCVARQNVPLWTLPVNSIVHWLDVILSLRTI